MPRNITAAENRAQYYHKTDALAQTNQIKYDCLFLHGTENIKKNFSQDLKLETQISSTFFRFYIALKYHSGKTRQKNNLVKLELSKEIFLSQEYPDFGPKF